MSDPDALRRFNNIAQKWRELAELRCAHFTELYKSGRWKRYYSEPDLILRMREVISAVERWAVVAPRATDDVGVSARAKPESAPAPLRRDAA